MNVRELFHLTLKYLGEETDEYSTEEFRFVMLAAFNRAYMEIMRNKRKPERSESVTLENGAFDTRLLQENCISICAVLDGAAALPFVAEDDGRICVRCEKDRVKVRYRYLPKMLAAEDDAPQFPEEFHALLADYAAYTVLGGTARQPRADFYMRNYLQGYARIPPEIAGTRLVNKY